MSNVSPSPIQRLIILHLGLAKLCTGTALDETASLDEVSEQILYYHDASNTKERQQYVAEAVQFAGLCTALYSLPDALGTYDTGRTKEVQFSNSTLVFVPLEKLPETLPWEDNQESGILAIAQLPRSSPDGSNAGQGSGNSMAVQASINRCHILFCMLRGGKILHRLWRPATKGLPNEHTQTPYMLSFENEITFDSTIGDEIYFSPDLRMKKLFEMRKTARRLRDKIRRQAVPTESSLEAETELMATERIILDLSKDLPINSVRDDLRYHYDAYLGDLSMASSRNGGPCRCLVENTPPPLPTRNGSHTWRCDLTTPPASVSVPLGQTIRSLLSGEQSDITEAHQYSAKDSRKLLVAISTFFQGNMLFHHSSESLERHGSEEGRTQISPCVSQLLGWYMSSYGFKVKQQQQNHDAFSASTPPRRLSPGFLSFKDASPRAKTTSKLVHSTEADRWAKGGNVVGSYMETPPLAMLSASELEAMEMLGPNDECVWAPLVQLPLVCEPGNKNLCTNQGPADNSIDVHIVLYEWLDFSFLLYILPPFDDHNGKYPSMSPWNPPLGVSALNRETVESSTLEAYKPILSHISMALCETLSLTVFPSVRIHDNLPPPSICPMNCGKKTTDYPGQDIIFINRTHNQLMLLPKNETWSERDSVSSPKVGTSIFGARRAKNPLKADSSDSDISWSPPWSKEGLDCRHLLASSFSLDAILAFDDVMNEIAAMKLGRKSRWKHSGDNYDDPGGAFELCTSMSKCWIYAYADLYGRELYILFDSKCYVTMSDVQNAAALTRSALLGDLPL